MLGRDSTGPKIYSVPHKLQYSHWGKEGESDGGRGKHTNGKFIKC